MLRRLGHRQVAFVDAVAAVRLVRRCRRTPLVVARTGPCRALLLGALDPMPGLSQGRAAGRRRDGPAYGLDGACSRGAGTQGEFKHGHQTPCPAQGVQGRACSPFCPPLTKRERYGDGSYQDGT